MMRAFLQSVVFGSSFESATLVYKTLLYDPLFRIDFPFIICQALTYLFSRLKKYTQLGIPRHSVHSRHVRYRAPNPPRSSMQLSKCGLQLPQARRGYWEPEPCVSGLLHL